MSKAGESLVRRSALPILAGGLPAAVYLATMAPTVYGLDSAELTAGAYVLGIVHAPGAPVFMLLGHLFTYLPVGDVGYRVNLLSMCAGASAIAVLCAVMRRLVREPLVALGASWVLAFSFYYWISALAAELYALHAFFVCLLLWLGLRWQDRQLRRDLALFGFMFGLGLGNHLALITLAPGLFYLALGNGAWRRPSNCATLLLPALCGVAIYLYLPLRAAGAAPLNYAQQAGVDVTTLSGFLWMVRGGMFESQFFAVPWTAVPQELARFLHWLWSNFVGVGCVLGLIGLSEERVLSSTVRRALVLMFIGHVGFMLSYGVPDKDLMLGPSYIIWTIWLAFGAQAGVGLIELWLRRPLRLDAGTLLLGLCALLLSINYTRADISDDWSARHRGEAICDSLEPNSVFIGSWAEVPLLEYLSLVEGRCADVERANVFFYPKARAVELARGYLIRGRDAYTTVPQLFRGSDLSLTYLPPCDCHKLGIATP